MQALQIILLKKALQVVAFSKLLHYVARLSSIIEKNKLKVLIRNTTSLIHF